MASLKSKSGPRNSGRQARPAKKSAFARILSGGISAKRSNRVPGLDSRHQDKVLRTFLKHYGKAVTKSRSAGHTVSFRVDVNPEGAAKVTAVEDVAPLTEAPSAELQDALAAARERGRLRAAEILNGEDMLSAEEFAELLGTTRVTVNTKRQSGQLLGLDGAKRGFRFPAWQLDSDGKPFAELSALHRLLGGAWAVYRFLVQPHGEFDGLTGREALEQGKAKAVLAVAESVGRDFR